MNVLGISGLTIGGAGTWALVILGIIAITIWWVRGMADRKRADIAGNDSEEAAIDAQWKRFQGEIDRLLKRINQLEDRVEHLESELDESREREAAAVADLTKLRAIHSGQGQVRQEAAVLVAAERIVDEKRSANG